MQKILLALGVAAIVTACASSEKECAKLEGVQWDAVYIRINDSTSFDNADPLPYLVFTSDTTIAGNTGCNSFGGRFTLGGDDKITLSVEAMTMMLCMDVETEQTYLEQLQMAERYSPEGDTLVLYDPDMVPQIKFTKNEIER